MEIDWRTVQVFLTKDGEVDEVALDTSNIKKMRCTCRAFMTAARCKHVKFVRSRLADTDGEISLYLPDHVTEEDAHKAITDTDLFRYYTIRYGKVEVL